MPRLRPTTRDQYELLIRRPWLDEPPPGRCAPAINIVDQLEELATLMRRGVLSRAEFERQKRKVLVP